MRVIFVAELRNNLDRDFLLNLGQKMLPGRALSHHNGHRESTIVFFDESNLY